MIWCNLSKREINFANLSTDPGLRTLILDYHPNDQDLIPRANLQKGLCKPRNNNSPQKRFAKILPRFSLMNMVVGLSIV